MELFEKLTSLDKEMIDDYVNRYYEEGSAGVTTSEPRASLKHLLRFWNTEKRQLYQLFGEELIIKREIATEATAEAIREEIESSGILGSNSNGKKLHNKIIVMIDENRLEFGKIMAQSHGSNDWGYRDLYRSVDRCFDSYTLARAKYSGYSHDFNWQGTRVTFAEGMKPIKIITKLVKAFFPGDQEVAELLEKFRIELSMITNQKVLKGELCLSIHPLDYMTMSDNASNWNSCMNWRNGGCYHRGTVEMMNSPVVVVAYLKSNNTNLTFGDYSWNSKKWRELFVVTKDLVTEVKPYPYVSPELTETTLKWLKELLSEHYKKEYTDIFKYNHDYTTETKWGSIKICMDCETMYNDFEHLESENMAFALKEHFDPDERYEFFLNYSGEGICMHCGRADEYFENEGTLICEICTERIYCARCGDRITGELYELDGKYYDWHCYDTLRVVDPLTGEEHNRDNCIKAYVLPDRVQNDFSFASLLNLNLLPCVYIYQEEGDENSLIRTFKRLSWGCTYSYILATDAVAKGMVSNAAIETSFAEAQRYDF